MKQIMQKSKEPSRESRRSIGWNMGMLLALVVVLVGLQTRVSVAAELSKAGQARLDRYGKFGGPFTLVDQTGKTVKDTDFFGKYMFIFFGYTSCPDICPTAMQTVSDTLDIMGDAGKDIQPILITVDPERDTPEVLADFIGNFSPRIVGLTGDKDTVTAAARNYGVRFEKAYDTTTPGDHTKDEDYQVNHAAVTFLMDKKGKFLVFFPGGVSPDDMAKNLLRIIKDH